MSDEMRWIVSGVILLVGLVNFLLALQTRRRVLDERKRELNRRDPLGRPYHDNTYSWSREHSR